MARNKSGHVMMVWNDKALRFEPFIWNLTKYGRRRSRASLKRKKHNRR